MRHSIVTVGHVFAAVLLLASAAGAQPPRIIFGNNALYDPKDSTSSPCSSTTIRHATPVKHNETVDWSVKNGDNSLGIDKCTNVDKFDDTTVTLEFTSPSPIGAQTNKGGHIKATVRPRAQIPDGAYHFKVLYGSYVAEDPELDVKGDMVPPIKGARGRGAAPKPKH